MRHTHCNKQFTARLLLIRVMSLGKYLDENNYDYLLAKSRVVSVEGAEVKCDHATILWVLGSSLNISNILEFLTIFCNYLYT